MSKASLGLVRGRLAATELVDELDRLYCYEQVVAHWCDAVENRLTGLAAFVLPDELAEVASAARTVGDRLAARIAQLDGTITADPSEFVSRAPIDGFELPVNFADLAEILAVAIGYERAVIVRYGELVDRLREVDIVSYRLLAKILSDKLAREDEIEAVLIDPHEASRSALERVGSAAGA